VLPDCSTAGTIEIPCPGAVADYRCDVLTDGQIEVGGPDVSLVWEKDEDTESDAHTLILPFGGCVDPLMIRCIGANVACNECTPGTGIPCGFGACLGVRTCNVFGCPGPCSAVGTPEICNGVDDDCDDAVLCSSDSCVAGLGCVHFREDFICQTATRCAVGVCTGGGASPPAPAGSRLTPEDPNGCRQILRDGWCELTTDRCACNGMSVCVPGTGGTGCFAQLAYDPATGVNHAPCEDDANNCTLEGCCEPNDLCIAFNGVSAAAIDAAQTLCTSFADEGTAVSETGTTVTCTDFARTGPNLFCPGDADLDGNHDDGEPYQLSTNCIRVCDDNNACTLNSCVSATGACMFTNVPPGTQIAGAIVEGDKIEPDCKGQRNGGCGENECSAAGTCILGPREMGDPLTCVGDAYRPGIDVFGNPTRSGERMCGYYACSGLACHLFPDNADCSDDRYCNGEEQCRGRVFDYIDANGNERRDRRETWGCQPSPLGEPSACVNTRTCVHVTCDERADACSFNAFDRDCNNLTLNPCQYTQTCSLTGPPPSGCIAVVPNYCGAGRCCDPGEFQHFTCRPAGAPECVSP
jgi:hypothetical protein